LTSLPKALEPWEPELRLFAGDLAPVVGALSARLSQAIGPLRVQTTTPSDEPNGYASLSRRGPYERLLASEWALQLESPDEFVRRASQGEQLFLELERSVAATSMEAWLLLDCGPSQLGAPRLAHLAALVAFSRRAREAGLLLRWASLRNWDQPPQLEFTPGTISEWLTARSPYAPTAFDASTWSNQLPTRSSNVVPDVWLVGGPSVVPFAAAHAWSSVVVGEGDANHLEVRITPGRRRAIEVRLPLPEQRDQVRLLRDPFTALPKPKPPTPKQTSRVALHPKTRLAFSHDGHRLFARTDNGGVTALPVRNTARATYGLPRTFETSDLVVAAWWTSRRNRGVVVSRNGELWERDWEGRLQGQVSKVPLTPPDDTAMFRSALRGAHGFQTRDGWFDVTSQQLQPARAVCAVEHRVVLVTDFGEAAVLPDSPFIYVARVPARAPTFCSVGRQALFAWRHSGALTLVSAPFKPGDEASAPDPLVVTALYPPGAREWTWPASTFADYEPGALVDTWTTPGVLGLHKDGVTVGVLTLRGETWQWVNEFRARAPIESLVASANGQLVAWRDEAGEVGVYSRDRAEIVLRVSVDDASKERP
jgi:hypothetical protein